MGRRWIGLLLIAVAAASGAAIARHPKPLVRTAVTVAATLVLVAGAALTVRRPDRDAASRPGSGR